MTTRHGTPFNFLTVLTAFVDKHAPFTAQERRKHDCPSACGEIKLKIFDRDYWYEQENQERNNCISRFVAAFETLIRKYTLNRKQSVKLHDYELHVYLGKA